MRATHTAHATARLEEHTRIHFRILCHNFNIMLTYINSFVVVIVIVIQHLQHYSFSKWIYNNMDEWIEWIK